MIGTRCVYISKTSSRKSEIAPFVVERKRIDGWVREGYNAGNMSCALQLAVNENAYQNLQ